MNASTATRDEKTILNSFLRLLLDDFIGIKDALDKEDYKKANFIINNLIDDTKEDIEYGK